MSPEQKIKAEILQLAIEAYDDIEWPEGMNIDEAYEAALEKDIGDLLHEFRGGTVDTGLPSDWSRHYESRAVATQIGGTWVGWTFWYGGGKYGEPRSIDWMEDAYELKVTEEEKLVTVQTFERIEDE